MNHYESIDMHPAIKRSTWRGKKARIRSAEFIDVSAGGRVVATFRRRSASRADISLAFGTCGVSGPCDGIVEIFSPLAAKPLPMPVRLVPLLACALSSLELVVPELRPEPFPVIPAT